MKIRVIALMLTLATLLCMFWRGATVGELEKVDAVVSEKPNFIGGKTDSLANENGTSRPEKRFNLAEKDASGLAKLQIVYPARASQTVKDEASRLAEDIFVTTGVELELKDHFAPKKEYEIILQTGMEVIRPEILSLTDEYNAILKDNDFLIKICDTRLVVYGKTEQAVKSGVLFLIETISYKNTETGEYGVDANVSFSYQPVEHPPVEVLSTDEHYFEFVLENSMVSVRSMKTYVRLSFTGNAGWRLQTKESQEDSYNNVGAAQRLALSLGEADPSVLEEITVTGPVNGIYQLTASDKSSVSVNTNKGMFRLDFYTPSGKLASSVTNISTNTAGSMITGALEEDEAIYGTGERFNNANQRGQYLDMFSKDMWSNAMGCYMVIPLLCSSRGSGIFVNLYEPMTMDLGKAKTDEWKATTIGTPLDVYFYTTEKISDVIYAYSDLTGYAGMPDEWTYGMIVCAYSPDLSKKWTAQITPGDDGRGEGIYETIANMEKYDLPWTGILAEAYGYAVGTSSHDDLKELCDYVHSLGKKFLVYMAVASVRGYMQADADLANRYVGSFMDSYYLYQQKSYSKGYMIPQTGSDGSNPDNSGGTRVYLDITNPDAVNWYFNEYWAYLINDIGVDGCKIDFCEQLPENFKLLYYDKSMQTPGSHHWYPTAFCSMFWDMISQKPDSGMCYTRGGGIGSQRGPYMWAGDQMRIYSCLGMQLTAVLSSGLSGVPYMSYDMAGYKYGDKNIEAESRVFIRGTQFTAFTVCMQTHGTVRRSYQFANEDPNYTYVTDIYRAYVKLHEHLTPYITELCEEASTTGMPVMRHLILGWQDDKNVYSIEDEYTFGDAFLLAPILTETNVRKIYLPEGEWLDLNKGDVYSVGAEGKWLENYEASIAELPTFYNMNTVSEIAPTLVSGICDLYDYARSVAP